MKVAIWGGAGAIGRSVAATLGERGLPFRVVGRTRSKLAEAFGDVPEAEIVIADVATEEGAAKAAEGADVILYSLGLPYTKKAFATYPPMMRTAVRAARDAGVEKLVHISNVYAYGRPKSVPVDESHPLDPCSVKGRHRKAQEDAVLEAHAAGDVRGLVLRLPDFYGPHAELSISHLIFKAAVAGGKADLLGPIDTPHEFVFTPDVGPIVCDLAERDDAFGEAYNFAGPGSITTREFATRVFAVAGAEPRWRVAGPLLVKIAGLFSSLMRELSEMSYLLSDPVLLDDSKLEAVLGELDKTSYDEGIRRTVEALRAQSPSP